jgi:hypothetical protein
MFLKNFTAALILFDNQNFVTFLGQLLCQLEAYFTGPDNNDAQKRFLPKK